MINKVKQKQICRRTCDKRKKKNHVKHCSHVSSGRTTSTSPFGTPVKFHSSQRNVALLTPPLYASLSRWRFPIIQTSFVDVSHCLNHCFTDSKFRKMWAVPNNVVVSWKFAEYLSNSFVYHSKESYEQITYISCCCCRCFFFCFVYISFEASFEKTTL